VVLLSMVLFALYEAGRLPQPVGIPAPAGARAA